MDEKQKNQIMDVVRKGLADYLSEKQLDFVMPYFLDYPMRLKIVHVKRTYWGLCRFPRKKGERFLITLVRTDAPSHFFLVFLHEIAHMLAHITYDHKISSSHGKEWGMIVRNLVVQSANAGCYTEEEIKVIARYISKPIPLSNAKMNEMEQKIMQMYKPDLLLVSALPPNAIFTLKNGLKMKFIGKLRKYYECLELNSGKKYRVNPNAEVESWEADSKS